ncbi:MAG: hypothetical protein V4479_08835 [Actinomycetota bacterium]
METNSRQAAVEAGEALLVILRQHIDEVAKAAESEDVDSRLWEAVGSYGDALDDLYEDDEDDDDVPEPDEITFTVRTRYDYTVVDEKAFLAAGRGVGQAVFDLLERAGRTIPALDVPSLEAGSGLVTVHVNDEPLAAGDFDAADETTDLLLVDPKETLAWVLTEPVYGSRAEAEAAAKKS